MNVCHPAHPYLLLSDDSISHICQLINTPTGQDRAPPRIDLQMVYTAEGGLCCFSAAKQSRDAVYKGISVLKSFLTVGQKHHQVCHFYIYSILLQINTKIYTIMTHRVYI